MPRKFIIFITLSSIVISVAFAANWVRQQRQVYRLTIATGRKGGDYYKLAETLVSIIAKHQPRIQIQVLETSGSIENAELLAQKKVDFALVQNDVPTRPSFRFVALLYSELFHLIVGERSGIKNVWDIKGKRLALPMKGTGSYLSFEILLNHYNLNLKDFQSFELSSEQAIQAFRQGKVDAMFRSVTLGNNQIRELLEMTRGQLVTIDQAAAMKIAKPYLEEATIPKGAYRGAPAIPDRELQTVGVPSSLLTHKDVDAEIVQEITGILFENGNDLIRENPLAATIRYPGDGKNLALPMHPGAAQYFDKDKPNFFMENADFVGLIMSLITLAFSGLWGVQRRLLEKQKNRADRYNLQLLSLIEQAEYAEKLEDLQLVQKQFFEIFKKVLEDLDNDRLSPESYQLFTFPCEVALTSIRHRELLLKNLQPNPEELESQT